MTARRYTLQNVEQEPPHSFGWETPDREAREDFRRGQVAQLIFRDASGNGEMLTVTTLESHGVPTTAPESERRPTRDLRVE